MARTRTEPRLDALPAITTARAVLRPLQAGDAQAFRSMTDDPRITAAVDFLASPFTVADALRLIVGTGDGRDALWGVRLKDRAELIGTVGTHLRGDEEIEIGYWLAAAWHGGGFASEAVAAMVASLLAAYPARRIVAECRPLNAASWRLLERVGFLPDGADGHRAGRKRLVFRPPG